MASNLEKFIATVKSKGLIKPSKFEVSIPLPQAIADISTSTKLTFKAFSCNTPSFTLMTEDEFVEVDAKRKIIYDTDKGDVTIQFYVDSSSDTLGILHKWKKLIVNENRAINYYNNFIAGNMIIDLLDESGSISASYTFSEIFPKTIQEMSLDWSTQNQLLSVSIVMAFRSYRFSSVNYDESGEGGSVITETTDRETITNRIDQFATSGISRNISSIPPIASDESYSAFLNRQFDEYALDAVSSMNDTIAASSGFAEAILDNPAGDGIDAGDYGVLFDKLNIMTTSSGNYMEAVTGLTGSPLVTDQTQDLFNLNAVFNNATSSIKALFPITNINDIVNVTTTMSSQAQSILNAGQEIQSVIEQIAPGKLSPTISKRLNTLTKAKQLSDASGNILKNIGDAHSAIYGPNANGVTAARKVGATAAGAVGAVKIFKSLFK